MVKEEIVMKEEKKNDGKKVSVIVIVMAVAILFLAGVCGGLIRNQLNRAKSVSTEVVPQSFPVGAAVEFSGRINPDGTVYVKVAPAMEQNKN